MIVKLNKNQKDYLDNSLSEEREHLKIKLKTKEENHLFIIELDDEVADEIRDWANEELQKKGFDENYELNTRGKILEELVDIFYLD